MKKRSPSDSYCLISGQISVSRPIWRMPVCSQPELERSIPASGPTSRCSGHTSSASLPYTSAPPSSAPLFRPQDYPHSCTREKDTDLRRTWHQITVLSPTSSALVAFFFVRTHPTTTVLYYWKVVAEWGFRYPHLDNNSEKMKTSDLNITFHLPNLHCVLDCERCIARCVFCWGPFQHISQVHRGDDGPGGAGQRGGG